MTLIYTILILLAILLVVSIPVYFYDKRRQEANLNVAFEGRESLETEEFYREYMSESDTPTWVVFRSLQMLEETLNADLSRLLPDDDFRTAFADFFDGDDNYDLVKVKPEFEEEFGIEISDEEAITATNIVLLADLIWEKLRQQNAE